MHYHIYIRHMDTLPSPEAEHTSLRLTRNGLRWFRCLFCSRADFFYCHLQSGLATLLGADARGMSFNPTFASPQLPAHRRLYPHAHPQPSNNGQLASRPLPSDTSLSSTTSALTLSSLNQQDINLLDAIIQRAPPSATSFLAVFKAYNDVLQERGIDAGQDVTYYRFLLKLGVLRGNWGERWNTVKSGRRCDASSHAAEDDDYDHSHEEISTEADTTQTATVEDDTNDEYEGQQTPRPQPRTFQRPITTPSVPLLPPRKTPVTHHAVTLRSNSHMNPPTSRPPPSRLRHAVQISPSEPARTSSSSTPSRPPSYQTYAPPERLKSTTRPPPPPEPPSINPTSGSLPVVPPPRTLAEFAEAAAKAGRLKLPQHKSPGASAINADETWKILRMERESEDFRRYMIMRRCWDAWVRRATSLQVNLCLAALLKIRPC